MLKRPVIQLSPFFIVGTWLTFSIALALWWVIFAYRFISLVMTDPNMQGINLAAKQRMLVYEGFSLIILLFAGGVALAYYILREYRRNQQIKEFFAVFSHDLKTPIASLRIQAESLEEELLKSGKDNLAKRLLRDTVRLELQLENSLFLANIEELGRMHMEKVELFRIVDRLRASWPELKISVNKNCKIISDNRALETIFKNLTNNAVVHGKATNLDIIVEPSRSARLNIIVQDNGLGYAGNLANLGEKFLSSGAGGSGIGLYLVKSLTAKMQGSLRFENRSEAQGFRVAMEFGGQIQ